MYEKLDKLRTDLEKAKQRKADAEAKVKLAEEKLREAENTQILSDISALKLTPEQVAQFLRMAASGQMQNVGTVFGSQAQTGFRNDSTAKETADRNNEESEEDSENDDMED